jgi:MFS family permease
MLAYASDVSAPKDRARALGSVGAAIGVGFMLGPALGGVLAGEKLGSASFFRPAMVAALLALFALILVVVLLRESHGREQRATHRAAGPRLNSWQLLRDKPGLRWLALAVLLVTFSQSTMDSIFAIWAMNRYEVGPRSIGFALFALALMAVIMQGGLMRVLVPRFGEYRLAYAGIGCFVAGLLLVAVGTAMPVTVAGLVFVGVGVGAFGPSGSALVSRQASASIRGAVMGVYQGSVSLARVLGPLLSGLIYSHFGHNAPFLLGGLITLQASWCVAAARRHPGADTEGG